MSTLYWRLIGTETVNRLAVPTHTAMVVAFGLTLAVLLTVTLAHRWTARHPEPVAGVAVWAEAWLLGWQLPGMPVLAPISAAAGTAMVAAATLFAVLSAIASTLGGGLLCRLIP